MVHRVWKSSLMALVLVAVVLPTTLRAQGQGPGGGDPPPPAAEYRASLMAALQNHMRAISNLTSGDVAYMGHLQHHAAAVHGIATMTADAFPEGTAEGSRASDDIWTRWDAFVEKLRQLQDGAAAMNSAAQAGDLAGVDAARTEVMASCRSCHTDFRLSPPRN